MKRKYELVAAVDKNIWRVYLYINALVAYFKLVPKDLKFVTNQLYNLNTEYLDAIRYDCWKIWKNIIDETEEASNEIFVITQKIINHVVNNNQR